MQLESQLEVQPESQPCVQDPSHVPSQPESHPDHQEQLSLQEVSQESLQPYFVPQLQYPSQEELQPSQEPSQSALHELYLSSCRRSRASSAPPVIADSFDERDEVLLSQGSPQPSTAESVIAKWTSIVNRGPCIDLSNA